MKKFVMGCLLLMCLSSPSYAWWDSYGGFTCGYMDPLTSFLDNIFGPPCPPPVAIGVPMQPAIPPGPPQVPGYVTIPTPGPAYSPMPVPWYTPLPRY